MRKRQRHLSNVPLSIIFALPLLLLPVLSAIWSGCGTTKSGTTQSMTTPDGTNTATDTTTGPAATSSSDAEKAGEKANMEPIIDNPFMQKWDTPFGMPPFEKFKEEHYLPAIRAGIMGQRDDVEKIANNSQAATFANTFETLDRSGEDLTRVLNVFYNLLSAETSEGLQAIAQEAAPELSALQDDIFLNEKLFARIKAVHGQRESLKLNKEQKRLVEETYKQFVRGGANLKAEQKERFRAINQELSVLGLKYNNNVLADTNSFRLVIENKKDLAGLTEQTIAAASKAAVDANLTTIEKNDRWLFTLHGPSLWPFLQQADNRDHRQKMLEAYANRGNNGGESDNRELAAEMAVLRTEKALMLGFPTWADYVLEERMATKPLQVIDFLDKLWKPALAVAKAEAESLQRELDKDGDNLKLQAWDWHYYTEKIRKSRYGLEDSQLRPYFTLENALKGAFILAEKLYGITFIERDDLPIYHPEVRTFEVKDQDGSHLGIFMADYHPRTGKRGGAWCSGYRDQHRLADGTNVRPVVTNVGSFTRPTGDTPALLSLDEVETLFHEMGHALHALMSNISYLSLGNIPRDFVELPSQLMENWVLEPELLTLYAKHYQTGEVIPNELIDQINQSRKFNQGFATVEYLAASYLDMFWHTMTEPVKVEDSNAFEKAALDKLGLIPEILPRYRSTYFTHIFGGIGYSAGYYSYIWSEMLDADAFAAFKETSLFSRDTATAYRREILEKSGSMDAMEMYLNFRGKKPSVQYLLDRRGLL